MLNWKQKQSREKAKEIQAKFAENLVDTKGKDKDIKEKIIKSGYALCDNSDELLEIIDYLIKKVNDAKAEASAALDMAQRKGRKLISLEKRLLNVR